MAASKKKDLIEEWLKQELKITKIGKLLRRDTGPDIPYRTLHRFCVRELNHGAASSTVRLADGEPGSELLDRFRKAWADVRPLHQTPASGRALITRRSKPSAASCFSAFRAVLLFAK